MRCALAILLVACGADPRPAPAEEPPSETAVEPAPAEPAEVEEPAPDLAPEERARHALADCYRGDSSFLDWWAGLGPEDRERVARSEHTGVALAGRWELERRIADGRLDAAAVDRFVAFFAERAGTPPPAWWIEALRSGTYHAQTDTTSYGAVSAIVARSYVSRSPSLGILTRALGVGNAPGGRIVLVGDGSVRRGSPGNRIAAEPTFQVPRSAVEVDGRIATHLDGYVARDFAIVIPFDSSSGGVPYLAGRHDSGGPRWSVEQCGGGRQVLGGLGVQMLEILPLGELVLVFGAESHAVYVDAIAIDDGIPVWRWNSDLWFARHGRAGAR